MLGKLFKYEIKATGRTFLPIYAAILVVALMNRLLGTTRGGIVDISKKFGLLQDMVMMLMVGLFIALGVLTIVVIIQRFSKNLLGDEGYLMFTLPVKQYQLILSKLLVTLLWSILSGIVAFVAFLIMVVDGIFLRELGEIWTQLQLIFNDPHMRRVVVTGCLAVGIGFVNYIVFILTTYLAMSTTQIAFLHKYRVPAGFVAFFVISTFNSWLTVQLGRIASSVFDMSNTTPELALGLGIGWYSIVAVILFFLTNYLLSKHLNLN